MGETGVGGNSRLHKWPAQLTKCVDCEDLGSCNRAVTAVPYDIGHERHWTRCRDSACLCQCGTGELSSTHYRWQSIPERPIAVGSPRGRINRRTRTTASRSDGLCRG